MNSLARQQQAMVHALTGAWDAAALSGMTHEDDPLRLRGLQAYRSNAHALAERALGAAFPVTAQLLGEQNFHALSHAFWHAHPPQRGDMGWWGDALPEFMASAPQLGDEPYLADIGRLEWALHRASFAADVPADHPSLSFLLESDPGDVRLVLAAGVYVIDSLWPVASILNAHLVGTPDLEEAGAMIRRATPEAALVWRNGLRPCLRQETTAGARFVAALQTCPSLGAALDQAAPPDLASWLATAVQTGLVAGASRL